jgi:DNA-directed RNA polymerase specialized sigma24 family protein
MTRLTDEQRDLAAAVWPVAARKVAYLCRTHPPASRNRDELTSYAAEYVLRIARRYRASGGMRAGGYAVARLRYLYASWTRARFGRRESARSRARLRPLAAAAHAPHPADTFAPVDARADVAALLARIPAAEREAVERIDLAGESAEALGRGRSFAFELRQRAKLRLAQTVRG